MQPLAFRKLALGILLSLLNLDALAESPLRRSTRSLFACGFLILTLAMCSGFRAAANPKAIPSLYLSRPSVRIISGWLSPAFFLVSIRATVASITIKRMGAIARPSPQTEHPSLSSASGAELSNSAVSNGGCRRSSPNHQREDARA